jgi:hypothetical protein
MRKPELMEDDPDMSHTMSPEFAPVKAWGMVAPVAMLLSVESPAYSTVTPPTALDRAAVRSPTVMVLAGVVVIRVPAAAARRGEEVVMDTWLLLEEVHCRRCMALRARVLPGTARVGWE